MGRAYGTHNLCTIGARYQQVVVLLAVRFYMGRAYGTWAWKG